MPKFDDYDTTMARMNDAFRSNPIQGMEFIKDTCDIMLHATSVMPSWLRCCEDIPKLSLFHTLSQLLYMYLW